MQRFPDPHAPEALAIKKDFIEGYNLNMAIPWIAAERGFIDAVIDPHHTRLLLRKSLHLLRDKQLWFRVRTQAHPASALFLRRAVAILRRDTPFSASLNSRSAVTIRRRRPTRRNARSPRRRRCRCREAPPGRPDTAARRAERRGPYGPSPFGPFPGGLFGQQRTGVYLAHELGQREQPRFCHRAVQFGPRRDRGVEILDAGRHQAGGVVVIGDRHGVT